MYRPREWQSTGSTAGRNPTHSLHLLQCPSTEGTSLWERVLGQGQSDAEGCREFAFKCYPLIGSYVISSSEMKCDIFWLKHLYQLTLSQWSLPENCDTFEQQSSQAIEERIELEYLPSSQWCLRHMITARIITFCILSCFCTSETEELPKGVIVAWPLWAFLMWN